MALTATHDTRLNKNPEMQSALARGLNFAVGTLAITYSGAGGLSWTLPFNKTVFTYVPPVSGYQFIHNVTTGMLKAYEIVVTTTALASTLSEVASDTDFTALTDSVKFLAFGF